MRISRGRQGCRGEMRNRHSAAEGALSGGAQRESAAFGSRGNAPRGADFFREAVARNRGRKPCTSVPGGSRLGQGDDRAFRYWLRAERRGGGAGSSEAKNG